MDAKLTIADKLGRGLTNGIFFVTRKWKGHHAKLRLHHLDRQRSSLPSRRFVSLLPRFPLCPSPYPALTSLTSTNTLRTTTVPPHPKLGRFRRTSPYREMLPPRTHRHDSLPPLRNSGCRPVLRTSLASRCVQTPHRRGFGSLGVCWHDPLDCWRCVWDAWMSWGEFQGMAVLGWMGRGSCWWE